MRSTAPKTGGAAHQGREATTHSPPEGKGKAAAADGAKAPSDTGGHAGDGDAHNIINGRKYTPRRGDRFDPEHDRGESLEPPGTHVFSREIRTAPFPPRFRQPTTIVKYSGETDPAVWLNDYRLACRWAVRRTTRSSSATSPFTSLTPHERGSSTCPRTRSITGPT